MDGTSGVRLLLELYCVIVVKHVAFFAVCATLTMAVTLTSLPAFAPLFPDVVVVSDLNKNICLTPTVAVLAVRAAVKPSYAAETTR